MNRDPLWNAIKGGLNGPMDPAAFERCMQDILVKIYPSLVPVVGGSDSGMDGAIASGFGPLPLICTTGQEVLENFRRSVSNHLARREEPHACVLATSQSLTPVRRDHILDEAKALGVRLINIHDQEDIVGRLYHDSRWRIELLGIPGDPPALSCFPPRVRNSEAAVLVGRDLDLQWLQESKGDLLLLGQPGSGKTHLHQYLAMQRGLALFLASEDAGAIADAIRDSAPAVVVVDDAHVHLKQIDLLRHIRLQIGAKFAIHANAWPHMASLLQERLNIGSSNVRMLKQLSQKQIRELIEKLGIFGPDPLLHLIIQQSEGRPGLTAALVEACKRDGVDRVWNGEALAISLLEDRKLVRDESDRSLLAAFAVGGDNGLPSAFVAKELGVAALELRSRLASLGMGGIVAEAQWNGEEERLAVRPPALRPILVRDVFFSGPGRLDVHPFILMARERSEVAHILLRAKQIGGRVPYDFLEDAVVASNSRDVWAHFSWVDEHTCQIIFDRYREKIADAAGGLFHFQPALTLDFLVGSATSVVRAGERKSENSLEPVKDWIDAVDELDDSVRRRQLTTAAVLKILGMPEERVDWRAALSAVKVILNPAVSSHRSPPGDPMVVQIQHGILPFGDLNGVVELWSQILPIISHVPGRDWRVLIDVISDWAWPSRHTLGKSPSDETYKLMRDFAKRMLQDLVKLPNRSRVAMCELAWIARAARLDIQVPCDPLVKLLFDNEGRAIDFEMRAQRRQKALSLLASKMLAAGAADAVAELSAVEREVAEFGEVSGGWDRRTLYSEIATRASDPGEWLEHMRNAKMPADMVAPFITTIAEKVPTSLERYLGLLFSEEPYQYLAVQVILISSGMSPALVASAIGTFANDEHVDDHRFSNPKIPLDIMKTLLQHGNPAIRASAALGEWFRTNHQPQVEIIEEWKAALVEMGGTDRQLYWLNEILKAYPEVAYKWASEKLQRGSNEERHWLWRHEPGIRALCTLFSFEQRRALLAVMRTKDNFHDGWFEALLGDDLDLLRDWIRECKDDYLRLKPLGQVPGERWERMCKIAFEEGVTAEQIWEMVMMHPKGVHSGPFSPFYADIIAYFKRLLEHEDVRFHPIAEKGIRSAEKLFAQRLEEERLAAVYGR